MRFLTNFGNEMVLLPVATLMLLWLARIGGWRTASFWGAALVLCGGGTALLKIYLSDCATPIAALNSPSGHASMSTLVYGGLALILGAEAPSWQRVGAGAIGAAIVLAIALSRLVLHAHSLIEVVVGCLIGTVALVLFASLYLTEKPPVRDLAPFFAAVALLLLLLHGHAVDLEPVWRKVATYLHANVGICLA